LSDITRLSDTQLIALVPTLLEKRELVEGLTKDERDRLTRLLKEEQERRAKK
jgi:hypothetical protein